MAAGLNELSLEILFPASSLPSFPDQSKVTLLRSSSIVLREHLRILRHSPVPLMTRGQAFHLPLFGKAAASEVLHTLTARQAYLTDEPGDS